MTKHEFIAAVADEGNFTKKEVATMYDAAVKVITNTLSKGEKIGLVGFGTFDVKERKATTALNPRTKEPVSVPAKVVPVLRFGKSIKDEIAAHATKSKAKKKKK